MESLLQENTWNKEHLFFWFVFLLFLFYNAGRRHLLGYLKAWLGSSPGMVLFLWCYCSSSTSYYHLNRFPFSTLIFSRNWRLIRWNPQAAIIYSLKLGGIVWEKGYSIVKSVLQYRNGMCRVKGSWTLEFPRLRMLPFMMSTFWGRFLQNLSSHGWEGKVFMLVNWDWTLLLFQCRIYSPPSSKFI